MFSHLFISTLIILFSTFQSAGEKPSSKITSISGKDTKPSGGGCVKSISIMDTAQLSRLNLMLTFSEKKIFYKNSLTLVPTSKWDQKCRMNVILTLPFDKSVNSETVIKATLKGPGPEIQIPVKVLKEEKLSKATIRISIPPLPFKPEDTQLTFIFSYESTQFPTVSNSETRNYTVYLKWLSAFKFSKSFKGTVFAEFSDPWNMHGSTLPEENSIENRHGWVFDPKAPLDLTIIFADFYLKDEPPEEKEEIHTVSPKMFIITTSVTVFVIAVLFGIGHMRKKARLKKEGDEKDQKIEKSGD
ncbi:MAG: hypothetical protein JXR95_00690 [Deltaproteobacteria bacterium]|nr:hypothetical protein [Deltaproteobacteria bacterium]